MLAARIDRLSIEQAGSNGLPSASAIGLTYVTAWLCLNAAQLTSEDTVLAIGASSTHSCGVSQKVEVVHTSHCKSAVVSQGSIGTLANYYLSIAVAERLPQKIDLVTRSVADFYQAVMAALKAVDIEVSIWTMPQEIAEPIAFELDERLFAYDRESAHRFWQILVQVDGSQQEGAGFNKGEIQMSEQNKAILEQGNAAIAQGNIASAGRENRATEHLNDGQFCWYNQL